MGTERRRRPPEEARREILAAAESLLAEGGTAAVQVRAIAARVGMTDAGVNHHFGTREQLLRELLRHGGHRIRAAMDEVVASWLEAGPDVRQLVASLAAVYANGYSELAVALHNAGWRDRGSGLLDPIVDALHQLRPANSSATVTDTRLAVAALHQALALEPLYGSAFRRSAGFTADESNDAVEHHEWWASVLERELDR
ncbi:MAG: TetR/AcrR family transcriptional regulator [Acidimicrobiales bacterium]